MTKLTDLKLFNKWDCSEVVVEDLGLKKYINLEPIVYPNNHGRNDEKKFWKSKNHIVERLVNKIMVSGHKGKKHWRTSGRNTGKKLMIFKEVISAFEIVETKLKKNPVQVLVKAIENGSPCAEVTVISYGGIKHPKSVDVSPQRRIDLALRWIALGAHKETANNKKSLAQALANNIISAYNDNQNSLAITKRRETERQAAASR